MLKKTPAFLVAILTFAALFIPGRAHATSQACPSADIPGTVKVLHPLTNPVNFNATNQLTHVWLGSAYPYGLTAMVVVVYAGHNTPGHPAPPNSCTVDYLVDSQNQGVLGLPEFQSAVCFGNAESSIDVAYQDLTAAAIDRVMDNLTGDQTLCQRANIGTLGALNYNGNQLAIFALGASDHVHGGQGVDLIYGGAGDDDVDEGGFGPFVNVRGYSLGEDGGDYVYGSPADLTVLRGGTGNDAIHDQGGAQDSLFGDEGVECCMEDVGRNWSMLDCGPNGGSTDRLAGTINCTTETGPGVCLGKIGCP